MLLLVSYELLTALAWHNRCRADRQVSIANRLVDMRLSRGCRIRL